MTSPPTPRLPPRLPLTPTGPRGAAAPIRLLFLFQGSSLVLGRPTRQRVRLLFSCAPQRGRQILRLLLGGCLEPIRLTAGAAHRRPHAEARASAGGSVLGKCGRYFGRNEGMGGAASRRPHAQTRPCLLQSAARLVEEAMPSHSCTIPHLYSCRQLPSCWRRRGSVACATWHSSGVQMR